MDDFKVMLLEISDRLSQENVEKLKFLCSDKIGSKKREQISSGVQLFECLIQRTDVGPQNTELLRELLRNIEQEVLLELIDRYECKRLPIDTPNREEQEKINQATDIILQNLGRNWIQYGRKLGLTEMKLEFIKEKHPRDLEEQTRQVFKEWQKMRKTDAKVHELISALRACDLNFTADVVEKKLKNPSKS